MTLVDLILLLFPKDLFKFLFQSFKTLKFIKKYFKYCLKLNVTTISVIKILIDVFSWCSLDISQSVNLLIFKSITYSNNEQVIKCFL